MLRVLNRNFREVELLVELWYAAKPAWPPTRRDPAVLIAQN